MAAPGEGADGVDRQILADVAEHGVHVVHVPEDGRHAAYSFSVGLWHHWQHPEVVVFGLEPAVAQELIEAVADAVDAGQRLVPGQRHDGYLADYPIQVASVPRAHLRSHLEAACRVYQGDGFEAVQVLWPDRRGRFPQEEGVHASVRQLQPLLERLRPGTGVGGGT